MIRRVGTWHLTVVLTGLFLMVSIAGWGFPGDAMAATLHVPKDYPGIQKALDAAKQGDTVRVSEGTYVENVSMKQGVTLEGGWSKDFSRRDISAFVTTIDGKGKAGWTVLGADGATLDGFTVINATRVDKGDSSTGAGVHCESTSPVIVNNTIKGNAPAGIYCKKSSAVIKNNDISESEEAGLYLENGCSVTIHGNTLWNNKMAGVGTGGMVVSKMDVRNNVIYSNGMAGVDGKMATGSVYNNIIYENKQGGVRCVKTPMDIVNNTIVANIRSGVVVEDPAAAPTIKNNVMAYNDDAGIRAAEKGYVNDKDKGYSYSYNLLFSNNATGDCYAGYLWCVRRNYGGYEDEESYLRRKDIIADPLFVDALHHDYHLKPQSPAVDAGDPDPKFEDKQFPPSLGASTNDMGAYGGPSAVSEKRESNNPPVAEAGPSQQVYVGDRVTLDGGRSVDPDGDQIAYQWEIASKPQGSQAKISKPENVKTSFKADVAGKYTVQLTVKDRLGKSGKPHAIQVDVLSNHPPTANAGEVISNVYAGDSVTLYGGGCKDPDGDPLTYRWEVLFRPSGSRAALSDPGAVSPSLAVDALGCYAVQLIANDGKVDSEPDTVYVSTKHKAGDGKRNVPTEYPTIQSALDAAEPGDDIVVQQGTYKENIIIDKGVNLIGVGWPVIDGGSKDGDVNTIMIPYLGDKAGKVEGFVITGGGKGAMGHGINIWDSSPTIANNKIFGCKHNGIGMHGAVALTGKTKIYGNHIYDNAIGIGNGRGSRAHIYENHIYNNPQVGVGSRGQAGPRIERNYIYGNGIGVGAREVASPQIEGNHIYDNDTGVAISPIATVRNFAGEDIIIRNNLVFNNRQVGISITSFNLSKVVIANNTIDSNNVQLIKDERAGGVVLGYPYQGKFTAVLENNVITNNKFGGLVNYTGTELFPFPGASLSSGYNNVWNNEADHVGSTPGDKDFSKDPLFVSIDSEKNGNYFLSQRASGQSTDSPCVDGGSDSASKLGLADKSTRADKAEDAGRVDVGYHYSK